MLSTLEKILVLRSVELFRGTPTAVLAVIAAILGEEALPAGRQVFAQGDPGSSMYVIVSGRVRVHSGGRTLNLLGERQVFGEMAMLDPEPRSASVTTVEDSLLLRVDHGAFLELMADRSEVAGGIIRVLTGHLRERVDDLAALNTEIQALQREREGGV